MLLVEVNVSGFRRFGGEVPHKLLVDSKLSCLIGANEVGKSSLLEAILHGVSQSEIPGVDRTRQTNVADDDLVVRMRFRLDDEDRASIAEFYESGLELPHWFTVDKRAGGRLTIELDRNARKFRAPRQAAIIALTENVLFRSRNSLAGAGDESGDALQAEEWVARSEELANELAEQGEIVDDGLLEQISETAQLLEEQDEEEAAAVLTALIESEEKNPKRQALDVIWERLPTFVLFGTDERSLGSEYDLNAVVADPPIALQNLLTLAKLDLDELVELIAENETGTVGDRIDESNKQLDIAFAYWTQKPRVRVKFFLSGSNLVIHVQSGTGLSMRLEERSDGLRQFVALVAATASHAGSGRPVLLIDEVETHLHYDAQVDLLRLLAEQSSIGQVIYSTHSAACLPDDLGNVRVVESDPEQTKSNIRQHFWSDTPGLGPLLMAMGAASLAFVPRRASLIAEGPSDLLLLPTLLKQATEQDDLGYQVAPGLSGARPGTIIGLDMQASRTAWLVDGDPGGMTNRDKLLADGIPEDSIFVLGGDHSGLTLEDLVDAEALVDAVSAYARDKGIHEEFTSSELDDEERIASLERWCGEQGIQPPSKVVLANRLLSMRAERELVSSERKSELLRLHEKARDRLSL